MTLARQDCLVKGRGRRGGKGQNMMWEEVTKREDKWGEEEEEQVEEGRKEVGDTRGPACLAV